MKRVAVTGIGLITPAGTGKEAFWENAVRGRCGIGPVTLFDCGDLRVKIAGEVKDFIASDHMDNESASKLHRVDRFALAAVRMAAEDACIDIYRLRKLRLAVAIGSTLGRSGLADKYRNSMEELSDCKLGKEFLEDIVPSGILSAICNGIGIYGGPVRLFHNACAAGNYAIGYAYDMISSGQVDAAFAGGADPLSRTALIGFNRLLSLTPDKCRPFDKNRKGLVVSEGAAILMMEEMEAARERGARIYGEIKGYGLGMDAYHITSSDPEASGTIKCIREAMKNSLLKEQDIDYISAHGTGTPTNDKAESKALNMIFPDSVPPVSSIKSMIGHAMGAASAIEAAACCLMLEKQIALPTMNYDTPDDECRLDCIPNMARPMKMTNVLSNAFAFGGNTSCLAVSKVEQRQQSLTS